MPNPSHTEESAVKPEPELKNTIECNLNPSDGPGKPNNQGDVVLWSKGLAPKLSANGGGCFRTETSIMVQDNSSIYEILSVPNVNSAIRSNFGVCFWHDPWIGGSPLDDSFPRLYRLDTNPNCNVFDRKATDIVHVSSDHLVSFGPEDTTSPPGLLFQWA
ncbi:hypothetical protein Tco_0355617 [Tanacetum coccineum]